MLILSAFLVANAYVAAVLGVVGIGVTIHLLKLKTLTGQQLADGRARREAAGAGGPPHNKTPTPYTKHNPAPGRPRAPPI